MCLRDVTQRRKAGNEYTDTAQRLVSSKACDLPVAEKVLIIGAALRLCALRDKNIWTIKYLHLVLDIRFSVYSIQKKSRP
jgi:hypothetical protein